MRKKGRKKDEMRISGGRFMFHKWDGMRDCGSKEGRENERSASKGLMPRRKHQTLCKPFPLDSSLVWSSRHCLDYERNEESSLSFLLSLSLSRFTLSRMDG